VNVAERIRQLRWTRASPPPDGMVRADRVASRARRGSASRAPADPQRAALLARRARLDERFALMQADLGGLFYEMAIRDHVRMDVLTTKAAELQRVGAQLAEVEHALHMADGPPTGGCPACGAPHGGDALFCSRCGRALTGAPAMSHAARAGHDNGHVA
jgi:hypothetical protein